MRFLNTSHTIAEYKHQQVPVYETLAAIGATSIAGTALTVGGVAGAAGTAALGAAAGYGVSKLMGGGGGGGGGGAPSYDPATALALQGQQYGQMSKQALKFQNKAYNQLSKQSLNTAQNYYNQLANQSLQYGKSAYNQLSPEALEFGRDVFKQTAPESLSYGRSLFGQAQQQGIGFARSGTQANIENQEAVTPGSLAQRQLAQNAINDYIQGRVPTDVQQNTQRSIAQSFGGGYNPFSKGGQAPNAFARNIGQTSVGLSQFGLSAAPTWQQLANQMVVSPTAGLSAGLQAASQGANMAQYGVGQGANLATYGIGQGSSLAQYGLGQSTGLAQYTLGQGTGLSSAAAGMGMQNAENQYQGAFNQYQGNQIANQNQQQMIAQGANMGLGIYQDYMKGNYTSHIPSYMGYSSPAASTGFAQAASRIPAAYTGSPTFSSVANVGSGLNFSGNPFG